MCSGTNNGDEFMNGSRFSSLIRGFFIGFTGLATIWVGTAWGQATDIRPRANARLEYSDNPRMQRENEDEATGVILDLRLPMTWATERTELTFSPRVQLRQYFDSDDEDLERNNWWLDAGAERRWAKSTAGLTAGYSEVGVIDSELDPALPDDPDEIPPEDGDGLTPVRVDEDRETWRIRPYYSYNLNQANRLSASASYTDTSFSKSDITGRADYEGTDVSGQWDHYLNPRDTISLEAIYYNYESNGRFDADSNFKNETDNIGVNLIYAHQWSETLTVSLRGGIAYSDIEATESGSCELDPLVECADFDDDDTNWLADFGIRKRSETTTLNFNLTRRVAPSSGGTVVTRDEIRFYIDQRFSPKFSTRFGGRYSEQESVGDIQRNQRDYGTAEILGTYRLSRRWSVEAGYRHIFSEFDGQGNTDARQNRIYVGVTFTGFGIQ